MKLGNTHLFLVKRKNQYVLHNGALADASTSIKIKTSHIKCTEECHMLFVWFLRKGFMKGWHSAFQMYFTHMFCIQSLENAYKLTELC